MKEYEDSESPELLQQRDVSIKGLVTNYGEGGGYKTGGGGT